MRVGGTRISMASNSLMECQSKDLDLLSWDYLSLAR